MIAHENRARSILCIAMGGLLSLAPHALLAQDGPPPAAVTVVTLQPQEITMTEELPGRVVALGVSEVRPQVSGIIVEQLFEEGKAVAEGDPMYRIDDATYAAQVELSRATVEQANVVLASAERDEKRNAELFVRKVVSQTVVDDAIAARDEAKASLHLAKAQLEVAKIDLEHTIVRAPLSGVAGRALATRGALATSGQIAPLAVIRQIDSVFVDVTASAADIVRRRRAAAAANEAPLPAGDPQVTLTLADGLQYDHTGSLLALEPQVDPLTGVSVQRLKFPNPDNILLPGMYVMATMPTGPARQMILAPQEGVSRDRRGEPTALVVDDQNVVQARTLKVAGTHGDSWIVLDGLAAGDRLIVAGLQKAAPGAVVAPQERAARDTSE